MDTKLLFVKAITLLYRESEVVNNNNRSYDLVKNILEMIKPMDGVLASDFNKDAITGLRDTLNWLLKCPLDYVHDKDELLQRLRVNVGKDQSLYDAILGGIDTPLDEVQLKRKCTIYRRDLYEYVRQTKIKEITKSVYHATNFHPETVDWKHFEKDLMSRLEPFKPADVAAGKVKNMVTGLSLGDVNAAATVFTRAGAELDSTGIIRFGWQGLNRMTGPQQGGRRGEFWLISALPNNFKSGFCLETMKQVALYNKPYLRDPTKKPLIVRLSFENPMEVDLVWLYVSLVENETRMKVDASSVDPLVAANYVRERLEANGYEIHMAHFNPSEMTYMDIIDYLDGLIADGYEIHACFFDYLNMISKRGCTQGATGQDVRDLFRRIRNYTAEKGILAVTPHQLSNESKRLLKMGMAEENFVREIAGKGYYDGCGTIDQEVDFEIHLHIVKCNGEKYLTLQRGKHRKATGQETPVNDLYCVYKFEPIGGIQDDLDGRDNSRKRVAAGTTADGNEPAWFHEG